MFELTVPDLYYLRKLLLRAVIINVKINHFRICSGGFGKIMPIAGHLPAHHKSGDYEIQNRETISIPITNDWTMEVERVSPSSWPYVFVAVNNVVYIGGQKSRTRTCVERRN